MRWSKVWSIFRKEFDDVIKSKYILFSLLIMPFLLLVILPLTTYLPIMLDPSATDSDDLSFFLDFKVTENWAQLTEFQQLFIIFVEFNWIYYLLIPIILPTIIAADSFAGEKDRGTVEGLIAAPITDNEIYLGKISTSLIPTIAVTWIYSIPFVIITNIFSQQILEYNYLPNLRFFILVFFVTPLATVISINIMIWASTRTSTTRDAQQFGSLLLLPLMLILINIAGLSVIFSNVYLLVGIVVMLIISYGSYRFGLSLLDRERWLAST